MKIGLIDVDGHNFPNVPLMKISAHYKKRGHLVEFYEPLSGIYEPYDTVFMSKVFSFTEDYRFPIYAKKIIKGGTSYDLKNKLPPEIETEYPDYSLYNVEKIGYGFLTRGCPRGCEFCAVQDKEGTCSTKVADLSQFWRGQREIKLLDPNLLACGDKIDLLHQLIDSKAYVDFTQGLDVQLMSEELSELIMKIKIKRIHFAWDFEKNSEIIKSKLKRFKEFSGLDYTKLNVYVLVNFNTDFEFDLERVYTLRDMGYNPYIMIYDKEHAPQNIRRLQRWVNNRIIFRTVERFEDYKPNLPDKIKRQEKTKNTASDGVFV
ncbi:radical SAM protein [Clostridia bacterium]|nr:radical SAM protein [Clostridia bacterium]